MRLIKHRPRIKLLTPAQLRPGEPFEATVVLAARRAVAIEYIDMELEGREECSVRSSGNTITQVAQICRLSARAASRIEVPAGESKFSVRFQVPETAQPTYQGSRVRVSYLMHVRAAIPWWRDARASFDVHMGHAQPARLANPGTPLLFTSCSEGPRANEPHMEGSLSSNVVSAGDLLAGAVALGNVAYTRYTGLRLALVGTERVTISGHQSVVEAHRYEVYMPVEQAGEGEPREFRIRVPERVPASHADPDGDWSLTWQLECRAEIRWGRDLALRVPITVIPWQPRVRREPVRCAPPTVGSERVQAIWQKVAARHGLSFDGARLLGVVAGCDLVIEREHRGRQGVVLLGRARYSSLYMDLWIGPARGLQRALSQGLELGERDWDRAHYTTCRDPTQLEAIAGRLRAVLTRLSLAHMNDRELLAEHRGAGATEASLDEFVGALVESARVLAELPHRIPPPALMREDAVHWRELARSLEGSLQASHMAIEGVAAGSPARVRTNWSPMGKALSTTLEVDAPRRIPKDMCGSFLGLAEEPVFPVPGLRRIETLDEQPLLREIARQAWLIEISAESIAVTLPAPIHDPRPLAATLHIMADWARQASGAAGPYR